jgi:hypothetical protein
MRQRIAALGALALTAANDAGAFQKCVAGTEHCISLLQLAVVIFVPAAVFGALAVLIARRIETTWLRRSALTVDAILWFGSVYLMLGGILLVVAPCTETCWYNQ